jgi:hypothetical protein
VKRENEGEGRELLQRLESSPERYGRQTGRNEKCSIHAVRHSCGLALAQVTTFPWLPNVRDRAAHVTVWVQVGALLSSDLSRGYRIEVRGPAALARMNALAFGAGLCLATANAFASIVPNTEEFKRELWLYSVGFRPGPAVSEQRLTRDAAYEGVRDGEPFRQLAVHGIGRMA